MECEIFQSLDMGNLPKEWEILPESEHYGEPSPICCFVPWGLIEWHIKGGSEMHEDSGKMSCSVTPRPHRARSSAAQRQNGKFSIVCIVLLSAAAAACVNTLLGNICFHFLCCITQTQCYALRALCGRGVTPPPTEWEIWVDSELTGELFFCPRAPSGLVICLVDLRDALV